MIHNLVGRVISASGSVETMLIQLLERMTGMNRDHANIIFYTVNSARARSQLIERLAKASLTGTVQFAVLDQMKRLQVLARTRNLIAHSEYGQDQDYNFVCLYGVKLDGYTGGNPVSKKLIDKNWINQMNQTFRAYIKLGQDIQEILPLVGNAKG